MLNVMEIDAMIIDDIALLTPHELHHLVLLLHILLTHPESIDPAAYDSQDSITQVIGQLFDHLCDS